MSVKVICPAPKSRPPLTLPTQTRPVERVYAEIALSAVHLGNGDTCEGLGLVFGFNAATGMVADYRVTVAAVSVEDFAGVADKALSELHTPKWAEVEIISRYFSAEDVVKEIKKISNRPNVVPNDGAAQRMSFDQLGREIGRQVRAAAAYQEALGHVFEGDDERQLFVESVLNPVLYWYHRRPWPGAKSPIERHAEAAAAATSA